MEPQKTPKSQSNFEKEKQSWRYHNQNFKLYYKAVIKTVQYWHKSRHKYQQNTKGNSKIKPQLYGQLISNKVGKNMQ